AAARDWPHAVIAPDGRTVVVRIAGKIQAWDIGSGAAVRLPEPLAGIKEGRVEFGDSKTLLAVHANTVSLFDWPGGNLRRTITLPEPLQKPGEAFCDAATLAPDGRWLATAAHRSWYREERGMHFGYAADGVLDLWNAGSGERVARLVDGGGGGRR